MIDRADGYVPNSVLAKILFPRDDTAESLAPKPARWKPPTVTDDMKSQIARFKVSSRSPHRTVKCCTYKVMWTVVALL